jgi:hypothetical protein
MQQALKQTAVLLGFALIGMHFVPTGTNLTSATGGVHMAKMIDPQVGAILDRSCQDCHSSNTHLPWYGRVAPISWILSRDVTKGREKLDFSQWAGRPRSANERMEICDAVSDGSMPLRAYTMLHRNARLAKQDVELICDWAAASEIRGPSLQVSAPTAVAETLSSSHDIHSPNTKGSR